MRTLSSILAWKTPWTEEPYRLQSTGVTESDTATAHAHGWGCISPSPGPALRARCHGQLGGQVTRGAPSHPLFSYRDDSAWGGICRLN